MSSPAATATTPSPAASGNDTIDGGAGDDDIDGVGRQRRAARRRRQRRAAAQHRNGRHQRRRRHRHRRLRQSGVARRTRSTGWPTTARSGENDLIGTDVENVEARPRPPGVVTLIGDGRGNQLDVVRPAATSPAVRARTCSRAGLRRHDQRARQLAGHRDLQRRRRHRARRHAGPDLPTCENVSVQATPGGPFDDRAPDDRLERARGRRVADARTRQRRCAWTRPTTAGSPRCSSSTTTAWSARTWPLRTSAPTRRAAGTSAATRWSRSPWTPPDRPPASCAP